MNPTPLFTLSWSEYTLNLSRRTHVMGVINVTPDSFSDGGQFLEKDRAVEQALQLAGDGADLIDIGGESTRPYSKGISADEEMNRVIPVIEALRKELRIPISIDTLKAQVAREALRSGASMVNDISALRLDPEMASVVAQAGVPVILMHMKGTPADMQVAPTYDDVASEIITFLRNAMDQAVRSGVRRDRIIVDPGSALERPLITTWRFSKSSAGFSASRRPSWSEARERLSSVEFLTKRFMKGTQEPWRRSPQRS